MDKLQRILAWLEKAGWLALKIAWTVFTVLIWGLILVDAIRTFARGGIPYAAILIILIVFGVPPIAKKAFQKIDANDRPPKPIRTFTVRLEELEQQRGQLDPGEFDRRFNQLQKDWFAMHRELSRAFRRRQFGPFFLSLSLNARGNAYLDALYERLKALYLSTPAP